MMKKFKRRSFGSGSRLEQHHEEAPSLDLSKDAAENMKELLIEITKKEYMATAKRMGFLNNFSQFVRSVPPTSNFGYTLNEITACLRVALISPAKEVRAAGFRAFRHLLTDEESLNVFLSQRVDIFISKSLDLPPAAEVERVQALRLVRKMVYLCPHAFPMSLAMSLAAISCDTSQEKDRMSRACLATLCELAVQNIQIASYSGVVGAIITNALDCSVPRMNESLISTILYLFNHPKYRSYVRRKVGLEPILAPFTDLYYRHNAEIPDNLIIEDKANRVESAKLAFVAIMRSWSGLVSLCDPDGNSLDSFLGVFQLPSIETRKAIIDTLYSIFCLRPPKLTDDFVDALHSVDPSSVQDTWKLTEDFLLAESDAVLPHRAQSTRANLIESYLSLILCAFIDAGIFESLVQVITTSDNFICIRGSILLGELLHMANMLLPPSYSAHTHCLPSLMSLATNLEKTPMERGKASAAVGYLDQLHQMKKRGPVASTLFMEHLIAQVSSEHTQTKSKGRQDRVDLQFSWRDMDEVLSAIRETQVMSTQDQDFELWNWDLISTILESPKMSIKRPDEPIFYRFIKRLTSFFKPSLKLYCVVEQSDHIAQKYSEVALQLTDFLLQREEQPEGEKLLLEVIQEIRNCFVEGAQQPGMLSGIFSTHSLNETLARDYFLIIGRLSSSTNGLRILEKTPGMFQYLMEICCMGARENLVKLIISCFDYGRDGVARVLLSKALTSAPMIARLYSTKFLRVLLRVKSPYFSNWGIEFLTNQLYDEENEIVQTAIDVLEEACEDEANLQRLIEIKPALLHLGEKGVRLLSRYVSVSRGFSYLQEMDYLNPLVEAWKTNYNREYVNWMELEIAESLSSYERHGADGGYIRRANVRFTQRKDVYVLPHFYGELAQNKFGEQLIQEQNLLTDAVNIVLQQVTETSSDIFQLKAALWSIGHIASTRRGIKLILLYKRTSSQSTDTAISVASNSFSQDQDDSEEECEEPADILATIIDMAFSCDVYTIRGTCFYVLGLFASTSTGADKLEELGWDCVRHKGSDIWPVIEPDITYIWEPDIPEEEQESEVGDETDAPASQDASNPAQERYGGIYLGDKEELESETPISFDYVIHMYGDGERRKGKKGKIPTSDESRYLQTMASMSAEEIPESSMKIKYYDVDKLGYKYEKDNDCLMSGLERCVGGQRMLSTDTASSIYLGGDDGSVPFSDYKPPEYGESFNISVEDSMPFLFGKMRDISSPLLVMDEEATPLKRKAIYDEAGIYLGEEEIETDDTIEANISAILPHTHLEITPYVPTERSYNETIELLKPIREEKSQESLIDVKKSTSKNVIDISVEEEITVEIKPEDYLKFDSSTDTSTLDTTTNSEEQTPMQTPHVVIIDNGRLRSVSLNEAGVTTRTDPESLRSSSFSGSAMHNKLMSKTQTHPRSGSDPGLGFAPNSLASSVSSQESDSIRTENPKKISLKKPGGRQKSRSENEDLASDRERSNSIVSDSSASGVRLRIAKRLRGGSTISLGVSPKSARGLFSIPSESPYSSSYLRDAGYGYTAWQTLKKQRSFKKELDSTLRRNSGAVSEKRKSSKSLAYQYHRIVDMSNHGRGSGMYPGFTVFNRRQVSSSSDSPACTPSITTDMYSAPMEDYVGRCLPSMISDFFRVDSYTYTGSWADNFTEFSESHNIQTFDQHYIHVKERCLACKIKIDNQEQGKTSRSKSDASTQSKSRSSSKDSPDTDVDIITDEELENTGHTPKFKLNVQKEVLRLVVNLSSAVASKGSQQEIISLRGRYPWAFQDLCLYSQVMEQLGMFSFRLSIRRFIQALFDGVSYTMIFETADAILGRIPA